MRATAYLMAEIDTRATPPCIVRALIASSERLTVREGTIWVRLGKQSGFDFHDAVEEVRRDLRSPHLAWLLPLMPEEKP